MINALPRISLDARKNLPECSAVYFVLDDTHKVYYIGGTTNLRRRWLQHRVIKTLAGLEGNFSIAWLEIHPSQIRTTEKQLTDGLCPPLNGYGVVTERRRVLGLPDPVTIPYTFGKPKPTRRPQVKCFSCDYEWHPMRHRPDVCARCHSTAWDDPNVPRATNRYWGNSLGAIVECP